MTIMLFRLTMSLLATFCISQAFAQEAQYKFTTGYYSSTGGGLPDDQGLDINLRRSGNFGNVWLAWYRSPVQDVSQPRLGWDNQFELTSHWRVQPSMQIASGGFLGGSVYAETGKNWVAGAGLGRTNLRPYVNLNFDPNDAWTAAAGYRWNSQQSLLLQVVRDNRNNPDQQNVHLVYRLPRPDGQRVVIDVLRKSGTVDDQFIRKSGLSIGYDWPTFFVRAAYDPNANFTPQKMWRMSVGARF
jgi:hypothetical protein